MSNKEHVVAVLKGLIEICRDGQDAYRQAAEHVQDPELKLVLSEVSLERAKFAGDLENEAVRWGHADDRNGSVQGAIQRRWTGLNAGLGRGDDAILSAVESADENACDQYDKCIRDEQLPEDIVGIIRNQAQAIVGTLDRIRALRRLHKAA